MKKPHNVYHKTLFGRLRSNTYGAYELKETTHVRLVNDLWGHIGNNLFHPRILFFPRYITQ